VNADLKEVEEEALPQEATSVLSIDDLELVVAKKTRRVELEKEIGEPSRMTKK